MSWEPDACIVGIGETEFHKRGEVTDRSEFELACEAVIKAADDAGIPTERVDGFTSYSNDRNEPNRLAPTLGIPEYSFSNMSWGGGGGNVGSAIMNAALAIHAGVADYVVALRSLCQGQYQRFGQTKDSDVVRDEEAHAAPYGLEAPPQIFALNARRYMHEYDVPREHLGHVSLTSRHHANRNPRAVMYDRELTMEEYKNSRMITEPFKLYDCCLESDGACAFVITSTENARALDQAPVKIEAAVQGGGNRGYYLPFDIEDYGTAWTTENADRLYADAGINPEDVDVAQIYENFTCQVLMTMEDYGLAPRGEAGELFASGDTLWPDGDLPINTSGGNLSEAYIHGFQLVAEGARQIRGTSPNQVDDVEYSLVAAGNVNPTSGLLLTDA